MKTAMKTATISYTYDPEACQITILVDGKASGGFIGPVAERKFQGLLSSGALIALTNMNSEQYKKLLIRQFHAALATQGIMEHKESILVGCGVEHTTELTIDQLKELVLQYSTGSRKERADAPATLRMLRSEILTILAKMNITCTGGDWTAVNEFCMKHAGKMIYQMDEVELRKARRQFNSIFDWWYKKACDDRFKSQNN